MEKSKRKIIILILIIIIAIATMIVIFTDKPKEINESTQDQVQITTEYSEIVDKDNSENQENESTMHDSGEDSVTTVNTNTSNSTTTTNKNTSNNHNSNKPTSSTSKNETTKPSSSTTKPTTKPTTPQHTHSWTPVYKEVDKGYYETVTKKETWTKCHICGADITKKVYEHMEAHLDNGEVGSYGTSYRYFYEDVWVPNIVKEVDYYKCSCGATK